MKRVHISVGVDNLEDAIRFYSTIFASEPSVIKDDYAKWMLDDPLLNFSLSSRSSARGVDHLGIQVETAEELQDIGERFEAAKITIRHQEAATCCYAQSDKIWAEDPTGVTWESFLTHGKSADYGESGERGNMACCAPKFGKQPKPVTANCC